MLLVKKPIKHHYHHQLKIPVKLFSLKITQNISKILLKLLIKCDYKVVQRLLEIGHFYCRTLIKSSLRFD